MNKDIYINNWQQHAAKLIWNGANNYRRWKERLERPNAVPGSLEACVTAGLSAAVLVPDTAAADAVADANEDDDVGWSKDTAEPAAWWGLLGILTLFSRPDHQVKINAIWQAMYSIIIDNLCQKLPESTEIYRKLFRKLTKTQNCLINYWKPHKSKCTCFDTKCRQKRENEKQSPPLCYRYCTVSISKLGLGLGLGSLR